MPDTDPATTAPVSYIFGSGYKKYCAISLSALLKISLNEPCGMLM
jgi:hypothetical protein